MKSLELFHLYYKEFKLTDVLAHVETVRAQQELYSSDYSRVVMLDDQPISKRERANFFAPILAQLPRMKIDYVVFETDLNRAKADWLALQDNAAELALHIKKVYNGNLQCSHYIAIWYLMRLGLLQDYGCFLPVSARAILGEVCFVQPELVNILPAQYEAVEVLTEKDILAHNQHKDVLLSKIERVYYE